MQNGGCCSWESNDRCGRARLNKSGSGVAKRHEPNTPTLSFEQQQGVHQSCHITRQNHNQNRRATDARTTAAATAGATASPAAVKAAGNMAACKSEKCRNIYKAQIDADKDARAGNQAAAASGVASKADLRSSVNMGVGYHHYWACLPPLPPIR